MNINERIILIQEKDFKSQSDLADSLGVSRVSVGSYVKSDRRPNTEVLEKFYNLGYSVDWLISGKGSMKRTFINEDELDKYDKIVFDSYFKKYLKWNYGNSSYEAHITNGGVEDRSESKMVKDKADLIIFDIYKNNMYKALEDNIYKTSFYREVARVLLISEENTGEEIIKNILLTIECNLKERNQQQISIALNKELGLSEEREFFLNLGCLYYLTTEANDFIKNFKYELSANIVISLVETKSMFSFLIDQIDNLPYVESKGNRFAGVINTMCKLV